MKKLFVIAIGMVIGGAAIVQAADVKELWDKHCLKCHGADGKGQTTMGKKLKVKDYTDPAVQKKFTDEEAIKITKEGKKEGDKTVMKGFSGGEANLSDAEIKELVAYVRKMAK